MNNTEWFKVVDARDVNIEKHISTLKSNVESVKSDCILLHAVLSQVNSRIGEVVVSLAKSGIFDGLEDLNDWMVLLDKSDRIVDKILKSNTDLSDCICELTVLKNKYGKVNE